MLAGLIKKLFNKPQKPSPVIEPANMAIRFKVAIIEFYDNVENHNGLKLAKQLQGREGLDIAYFNEPFDKSFLNFESRSLFDLIDKGQSIINKINADVLIWGYRSQNSIRINFQTKYQYENNDQSFVSLLDCLYIPAKFFQSDNLPEPLINLLHGAIVSAVNQPNREYKIYRKYLLKKIINNLSQVNSAKSLGIEYIPYIMNFLGIIYMSLAFESKSDEDFRIVKNLFDNALKHQDMISQATHLGCIYYHLGQLYDSATVYMEKKPSGYFRGAIENYRMAQKHLGKYNFPYNYGYICYKLSELYYNYWKQTEDLQALRDAVFQLREAEKIYTQVLFPDFWGHIQGDLGHMLHNLGHITKSYEICRLAINSYRNQQNVITERSYPLRWAAIQEKIGEIYYMQGKSDEDRESLEEALSCFHDALYIFENAKKADNIQKLNISISKTYHVLAEIKGNN